MRIAPISAALALASLGLLGLAAPARATSYQVSPVKLELGASQRSALLTLHNQSNETVRFQVTSHAWSEATDGTMKLASTTDVVVFPTMLSLKAGEKRKLRVATTAAPGATEKTYRVFVEELPPVAGGSSSNAVRVLTRMGIPIFVEPTSGAAKPAVTGLSRSGDKLTFSIKNTGSVHFVARKIRIRAADAAGKSLFSNELTGWYVLANGVRKYDLDLPALPCDTSRLAVAVETAVGSFESAFDPGVKPCSP